MVRDNMKVLKKITIVFMIIIGILLFSYMGLYLYAKITPKLSINSANNYYFYDINENLYNGNNENWISLNDISDNLINATISIEDKHFYNHIGFDYLRILKSLYINFKRGANVQGASTITQQYAKNLFLTFDKTWERKIQEAWLTIRLESHYSKNEILEGYLNTINYGGIFGIENASLYYFNKSSKDLSLAEASILAGIPKSPTYYNPISNYDNAKSRQRDILSAMVENKYISKEQMDEAYNEQLVFYGENPSNNISSLMYYQDAVIEELKKIKTIPSSFLQTGGLKIYTNINLDYQKTLEESVKKNTSNNADIQVASVVMDPNNGKILALVGGRNYAKSQYNRATDSKRQVGSTIKPFLYYAALENGFTSSTTFTSEKTTFTFSYDKTYSPKNYGDIYAQKPITMAAAIAYSDNIYAVKTHLFLGEDTLVNLTSRIGINDKLEPIPSLALGSQEINLVDMTEAYSTFANEGYKIDGYFIEKVTDLEGNVLYQHEEEKTNVLNKSLVFIINELLTGTYSTSFNDYNYPTMINYKDKITKKYAIKTGTTDSDRLIFGYNKDLVVGVWTGYDDNKETPSEDRKISQNIWLETIEGCLKGKEDSWYEIPSNVVGVLVDPISGKLATEKTKNKKIFYYIKGTEPTQKQSSFDDSIPTVKTN